MEDFLLTLGISLTSGQESVTPKEVLPRPLGARQIELGHESYQKGAGSTSEDTPEHVRETAQITTRIELGQDVFVRVNGTEGHHLASWTILEADNDGDLYVDLEVKPRSLRDQVKILTITADNEADAKGKFFYRRDMGITLYTGAEYIPVALPFVIDIPDGSFFVFNQSLET